MRSRAVRVLLSAAAVLVFMCLSCAHPRAEEPDKDMAAVAASMKDVEATLEQGLTLSARSGRAIAAKFRLDDGDVILSIYAENAMGFREVEANVATGRPIGATLLTEEADLKVAHEQSAAMAKASTTLLAATQHAVAANPGARAIGIYPELQDGHPVATVTLLRDDKITKVTEKLD
jgi:hypothetical protein